MPSAMTLAGQRMTFTTRQGEAYLYCDSTGKQSMDGATSVGQQQSLIFLLLEHLSNVHS